MTSTFSSHLLSLSSTKQVHIPWTPNIFTACFLAFSYFTGPFGIAVRPRAFRSTSSPCINQIIHHTNVRQTLSQLLFDTPWYPNVQNAHAYKHINTQVKKHTHAHTQTKYVQAYTQNNTKTPKRYLVLCHPQNRIYTAWNLLLLQQNSFYLGVGTLNTSTWASWMSLSSHSFSPTCVYVVCVCSVYTCVVCIRVWICCVNMCCMCCMDIWGLCAYVVCICYVDMLCGYMLCLCAKTKMSAVQSIVTNAYKYWWSQIFQDAF